MGSDSERETLLLALARVLLDMSMRPVGSVPAASFTVAARAAEQVADGARVLRLPLPLAVVLGDRIDAVTGWLGD